MKNKKQDHLQLWRDNVLNLEEFKNDIKSQGYYEGKKRFNDFLKINVKAASYLSIDFFNQQVLDKDGFFVLRTGTGKFIIFKREKFRKPYLELGKNDCIEITPDPKPLEDYGHLKEFFNYHITENSSLEQMRFNGFFKEVIKQFTGEDEFQVGPRGIITSTFQVYLKDNEGNPVEFTYHGQEDLDYSLFTKKSIFVIEGKHCESENGFDIGWHKLVYPINRLKKLIERNRLKELSERINIYPCYLLRKRNKKLEQDQVFFYIFKKFKFGKNGEIFLNDTSAMKPIKSYRMDLGKQNQLG